MSLNWDVSEVKDHEEITAEGQPWVITETLIWYTMGIDMGRITEDNVNEVFARVMIWEQVNGTGMRKWNKETEDYESVPMTFEDVERRIGLSTNVTTRDREEWGERIAQILFDRADSEVAYIHRQRRWAAEKEESAA